MKRVHRSARAIRRFLPGAVCLSLLAGICAACGSEPTGASNTPPGTTLAWRGADISALERIEQAGGIFRDGGQAGDALLILQGRGSNLFRLRVFVNPSGQDVEVNDIEYTVRMATRIKAAGARLLLNLHYSDTWADPGHQATPAAWAALPFDSLEQTVEQWTDSVVTRLKQAGALPDIVQVGNEIDGGMLWPLGEVSGSQYDTPTQWDQFTRLLKAGIRGIHDALDSADTVRIMLHYSQGGDAAGTQWFFDHMNTSGVPYDLIGLSYYPIWHGPLSGLKANLQATAARYSKDIMVVETSYPWRAGGWEGSGPDGAAMTWPISPQGQASFIRDVLGAVEETPGGHGAGVLWWYPEAIQVPGVNVWGGGSLALFDAAGEVLPAASEFRPR